MNKKNYIIEEDGFCGNLYFSESSFDNNKVLIVCGGSDGEFSFTEKIAEYFCKAGFNSLALAYINAPGIPKHTIEAPIETIETAVNKLSEEGFSMIGAYGISSGGEFVLLASTLIHKISCVIAVSSPTVISQADNGIVHKNTSCWSWQKKPFPYLNINYSLFRAIPKSLFRRELYVTDQYEKALINAPEDVWIPVENIKGKILIISAEEDTICPSTFFGKQAVERLKKANFHFQYEHLAYKYASHFVVPFETSERKAFRIERKFPCECMESCIDAYKKAIQWLENW